MKNKTTDSESRKINSRVTQKKETPSFLEDFDAWLEIELKKLEAKHESFATTNSNRKFYNR